MLLKDTPGASVIVDKAYGAQARVIELLHQTAKVVVIPAKVSRKHQRSYDCHLYRARHLIETFFARLKQYRAIATRTTRPRAIFWALFIWPHLSLDTTDDTL